MLQRQGVLPQCVPTPGADWRHEQKIPALDHQFPTIREAEVQNGGRDHQEAPVGIDDVPHRTALEFQLSSLRDGRVG
jgi:hypothetical protein